jgi:ubiquinone/menaquinone biosynthesis C-methylase UbiE
VPTWLLPAVITVVAVLMITGMFFFVVTRGALMLREARSATHEPASHVYPIYSNRYLMRLVDFQPIIAAILLFQYDRLVSLITGGLRAMRLAGKRVLITSCAFGNVMPLVAEAARKAGAAELQVVDVIENELLHARRKMPGATPPLSFLQQDATALELPDGSVDANVVFFLLHELPHDLKQRALAEACRVLAPGGKLFLAEFHRPHTRVLRALSWSYFKVFEPLGLALWSTHDPVRQLAAVPGMSCERTIVFFGNFQVIVATKAVQHSPAQR